MPAREAGKSLFHSTNCVQVIGYMYKYHEVVHRKSHTQPPCDQSFLLTRHPSHCKKQCHLIPECSYLRKLPPHVYNLHRVFMRFPSKVAQHTEATDILLDTSTNDGLNLIPFNFYAAHSQDHKGVALISEFCGCSSVLTGPMWDN